MTYEEEIEGSDPRRLRGGAFSNNQWFCRAAVRLSHYPGSRGNRFGFRVAEHLSISGS